MDTINFQKYLDNIPDDFLADSKEVRWQNLHWKRIDRFKYKAQLKNLYLILHYRKLNIKNSLHKFYHGNNYNTFTYKQLVECIEDLDNQFDFSIYDAEVIKYTPGLVVEASPEDSYMSWLDYKAKPTFPMVDKNKIYGKSIRTGMIKIKGYNKTYQANKNLYKNEKITDALFRLEAEVNAKYIARYYGISISKVIDLIDYEKYCKTLDLLLLFYDRINKDLLAYDKLDNKSFKLIGLFKDSKLSHFYKLYHKHSYKKDRATFKKISKDKRLVKEDRVRKEIIDVIQTMKTY